jgi:processive 1,2-diacylglycerol beta-glucosyltransferase
MNKPIQKILFLSMSAGAGHTRAAQALFLSCQKNYPEIQTQHVDILDYSTSFLKLNTASAYHFLVKYFPLLYKLFYKLTDSPKTPLIFNKISKLFEINSPKLQAFIKKYNPDLIISTHFLVPVVIKKNFSDTPVDSVITDYGLHGFWLNPKIRNFYVATEEMVKKLNDQNFSAFITGLPIHPEFLSEKNIDEIKKEFNLNPNWPTILLMSGGFGLKNHSNLIKKIFNNFTNINLVVIAGKNNKYLLKKYQQLKAPAFLNYQVIDFISNIEDLIYISDIIITKPGGITLTECAYLNKKIILTKPVPGQEELNEKYFLEKNLAIKINDSTAENQLIEIIKITQQKNAEKVDSNEKILQIALNKNNRE